MPAEEYGAGMYVESVGGIRVTAAGDIYYGTNIDDGSGGLRDLGIFWHLAPGIVLDSAFPGTYVLEVGYPLEGAVQPINYEVTMTGPIGEAPSERPDLLGYIVY